MPGLVGRLGSTAAGTGWCRDQHPVGWALQCLELSASPSLALTLGLRLASPFPSRGQLFWAGGHARKVAGWDPGFPVQLLCLGQSPCLIFPDVL